MDIRKSRDNFDKDRRPRCLNYNTYRHMAKECQKPKKDKEMRKYYKCDKVRYLAKDCRSGQKMKKTMISKRVLSKVQSRHNVTNLCTSKFPESICYSESTKQQSKRIKCTHQYQDKEQKETITTDTSRLRMYSYRN